MGEMICVQGGMSFIVSEQTVLCISVGGGSTDSVLSSRCNVLAIYLFYEHTKHDSSADALQACSLEPSNGTASVKRFVGGRA